VNLIDELYDEKSVKLIKVLYSEDPEQLYVSFGTKILEKSETFLISKPLDILTLLCMTASFAENKEECHDVAIIVFNGLKRKDPLPYVLDDRGFVLAEKTLVALSFFRSAMEKRAKKGAPPSEFYRGLSKTLFIKNNQENIAEHHEKWESFLSEIFI
jgi:hypothetical protein